MNTKPTHENLIQRIKTLEKQALLSKRTEDTLQNRVHYYQSLLNNLYENILIIEPDYRITDVNDAFLQSSGFKREGVIGRYCYEVSHGYDKPCDQYNEVCLVDKVLETKKPYHYRHEHRQIDGSEVLMEINLSPIIDQKGNITHLVKSTRDITGLINIEKALQGSEEKYRNLFEHANDSILIIDPSTRRFLDANENAAKRLGYTSEELLQLTLDDIYMPEAAARNNALIRELLDTGSVIFEHAQLHRDGTKIPVEVSSRVIEYGGWKVIQSIVRDISERRRAEAVLQRSRDDLEKRVEERTVELRRLSSKIIEAHEEESKRIGQELHDAFSQTLSAIKFRLEGALIQTARENPAEIVESLASMIPLVQGAIQEVRDISRNLWPSMLDDLGILPALSWLCKNFESIHPSIRIESKFDIEEADVPDALKIVIYRIVQEALNNIAKHSRADLVHITLTQTEKNIELNINDNGMGFDMENVFAEKKPTDGLGIASMKDRADLSGGVFTISSIPGTGTIVQASWPVK